MKTGGARPGYPSAWIRLRLIQSKPGLPSRETFQEIWTSGMRFHLRDETGHALSFLLEDASAEHGLGADPHSMEDIMDRWSQSTRGSAALTDLFGDLTTGEGVVRRGSQAPWRIEAKKLAPLVDALFISTPPPELERRGTTAHLGHKCIEYYGFLAGTHTGVPFTSEVTQWVSGGYLMLSVVRDAQNPVHFRTREIIALQEGNIHEHDLIPPEIPH